MKTRLSATTLANISERTGRRLHTGMYPMTPLSKVWSISPAKGDFPQLNKLFYWQKSNWNQKKTPPQVWIHVIVSYRPIHWNLSMPSNRWIDYIIVHVLCMLAGPCFQLSHCKVWKASPLREGLVNPMSEHMMSLAGSDQWSNQFNIGLHTVANQLPNKQSIDARAFPCCCLPALVSRDLLHLCMGHSL